MRPLALATALLVGLAANGGAEAATCGGNFDQWLQGFKAEAAAAGVSQRTIQAALGGVAYDPAIIRRDRGQGVFAQDFLTFSDRMVAAYRIKKGVAEIKKHQATFARVEREFGVPPPVIAAFWALETDFGANQGDSAVIPALATLAFDCRRPEKFRPQLLDALRILERGDLRLEEMRGAWAGEIGQVQFQPSDYFKNAIDYDGDGRKDLRRSLPDIFASTANLLKAGGWKAGQPWLEEVEVPSRMPWDQADLTIEKPRAEWARLGVKLRGGKPLPNDGLAASLLLPMGKDGPAFLAYPNFRVYLDWNQSLVYAVSAAYLATRIAGAPPVSRGTAAGTGLNMAQTRELQTLLSRRGYDVGKIDGILGEKSRAAVKKEQGKLGLPADSWPTPDLLARLKGA